MPKITNLKGATGAPGSNAPVPTQGVLNSRPSAAAAGTGSIYYASDVKVAYLSNGATWTALSPGSALSLTTLDTADKTGGTSAITLMSYAMPKGTFFVDGMILEFECSGIYTGTSTGLFTWQITVGSHTALGVCNLQPGSHTGFHWFCSGYVAIVGSNTWVSFTVHFNSVEGVGAFATADAIGHASVASGSYADAAPISLVYVPGNTGNHLQLNRGHMHFVNLPA